MPYQTIKELVQENDFTNQNFAGIVLVDLVSLRPSKLIRLRTIVSKIFITFFSDQTERFLSHFYIDKLAFFLSAKILSSCQSQCFNNMTFKFSRKIVKHFPIFLFTQLPIKFLSLLAMNVIFFYVSHDTIYGRPFSQRLDLN